METERFCQICDRLLTDGICPVHSHLGKQLSIPHGHGDQAELPRDDEFEGTE